MFLSDRDLRWAIETGRLIVEPRPEKIDPTSFDLHLDSADQAKRWDMEALARSNQTHGYPETELRLGKFDYRNFSGSYLVPLSEDKNAAVHRRGKEVIIKPGGFVLWQTLEEVGTPDDRADLICFVEGKSTKARTGILVHLTAPTIHSTWLGRITLEIANLGPFTFVLEENDVVAQLTVATISSPPIEKMKTGVTFRQRDAGASVPPTTAPK